MITKKKKIVVLTAMVALLVLTGFLNLTLNEGTVPTNTDQTATQNFCANYRTDRDSARNIQRLYWSAILDSANSTTTAREQATLNLNELAAKIEKELNLEGYILAKGFADVVVSFTDNYVNVMVKSQELTEAEVAQIVQVVQEQTKKSIDNIKIIPVE